MSPISVPSFPKETLREYINSKALAFLLDNKAIVQEIEEKEKKFIRDNNSYIGKFEKKLLTRDLYKVLQVYKSRVRKDEEGRAYVEVTYKSHSMGRMYAMHQGITLQTMPRKLRAALTSGIHVDVDFKNCHPSLLQQVVHGLGASCPMLDEYVSSRDETLNRLSLHYNCDRDVAKKIVLKIMNGGMKLKVNGARVEQNQWLVDFGAEMKRLHSFILVHYPQYYQAKIDKEFNREAGAVCLLLCDIENWCLHELIRGIRSFIADPCSVLMFDGAMFRSSGISDSVLKGAADYMKNTTGFSLEVATKDIEAPSWDFGDSELEIMNSVMPPDSRFLPWTMFAPYARAVRSALTSESVPFEDKLRFLTLCRTINNTAHIEVFARGGLISLICGERILKRKRGEGLRLDGPVTCSSVSLCAFWDSCTDTIPDGSETEAQDALVQWCREFGDDEFLDDFWLDKLYDDESYGLMWKALLSSFNGQISAGFIADLIRRFLDGRVVIDDKHAFYWDRSALYPRWKPDNEAWSALTGIIVTEFNQLLEAIAFRESVSFMKTCVAIKAVTQHGVKNIKGVLQSALYDGSFVARIDADPDLLGFDNGFYNLVKHEFSPHNRETIIMNSTGYNYESLSDCEDAIQTVKDLYAQIIPDETIRTRLHRRTAVALDGNPGEQVITFMTGDARAADAMKQTGSNAKSTDIKLKRAAFGAYHVSSSPALLDQVAASLNGPSPALAKLRNCRITTVEELQTDIIGETAMKCLTGGQDITCRELYSGDNTFRVKFSVFIACNVMPGLPKADGGTTRRVENIPFVSKFVDKALVEQTKEGLQLEHVYPIDKTLEGRLDSLRMGYMHIILEELRLYQIHGIGDCAQVSERTAEYLQSQDPMTVWAERYIDDTGSDFHILSYQDLLDEWKKSDALTKAYKLKKDFKVAAYRVLGEPILDTGTGGDRLKNIWRGLRIVGKRN